MEIPLVSIVTVVYNGAQTLEQTIKSVINQTYNNIEYILIDGGSTDGTLEIIKRYEDQIDLWVSEPDGGLYDAMNKGIVKANGELIGMINSDDWYEPNAVEEVVSTYKSNPDKRIFHGDRYDIRKNGTKRLYRFNRSKFKFLYSAMTYNHPSMFVHRSIYNKNKYNITLEAYSDYEFVLSQYLKNPDVFEYIPKTYVNYRLDGISARQSISKNLKEGIIARKNAGLGVHHILLFLLVKTSKLFIGSFLRFIKVSYEK